LIAIIDQRLTSETFQTSEQGTMAKVLFNGGLATSDPVTAPVMVVGQVKHLNRINWDTIKVKLEPRVNKEVRKS
jgi:probable aminopeptidase NPEPL1